LFSTGAGFGMAHQAWISFLHRSIGIGLWIGVAAVLCLYGFNRFAHRSVFGVGGRQALYVVLVLGLGAGLVVNFVLKDHFGRARPRNIFEFGGAEKFTPAFVLSDQCDTNRSFPSGDAAAAFFPLALALALGRRRFLRLTTAAFGVLVSLARVAAGVHFFS